MRKHRKLFIALLVIGSLLQSNIAFGLSPDEEITVRQNCLSVQVILQRMQYNDAANRVKHGQAYETLLSKFMLPLNSRTASNGFSAEAARLTEITDRYQQALTSFKADYDTYADKIDSLIRMKCKDEPQDFYQDLQAARESRGKIKAGIISLDQTVEEYRVAVNQVKRSVEE